ncbi:MAG: BlaI/MecI/CopY family transcriptional regulator [Clostridia bacterium]|nr:BlaI/MecI/CopY family transcriptional regulator [Clostridia bacterium]MBQ7086507.1 BlaI/MecI/CopY family transcriptional regulator [Clostridia bacterium]
MNNIKRLPDSELELMQIIWKLDSPVSRPDIEKNLPKNHQLAATTILTLLTRLCEKGFLKVEKQGKTNLYTPLIAEKDYLAGESRNILNRLYGGSLKAFAMSLVDSGVSKEEIDELRKMLEENKL